MAKKVFSRKSNMQGVELEKLCLETYGEKDWKYALAQDTGRTDVTVDFWRKGKHTIPLVVEKYLRLEKRRREDLLKSYEDTL